MNFMWGFSLFILFHPHTPDARVLWGIRWWSCRQPAEARGAAISEAKHLTSWQLMFNEAPRRGASEQIPLVLGAPALAAPHSARTSTGSMSEVNRVMLHQHLQVIKEKKAFLQMERSLLISEHEDVQDV